MSLKKVSSGMVHELPADLKKALTCDPKALTAWEDITPLARNEWICWIESAKKAKPEAAGSSGAVQALEMANDAPVVGPDASTANSENSLQSAASPSASGHHSRRGAARFKTNLLN